MQDIVVITDSSCDYSPEQAANAGFSMVPLTVSFGNENFLEGLEITPSQFYSRLAKETELPKTSQPSPEMFCSVFKKYKDAKHIVCITISSGLSGTIRSATIAAQMLEEENFAPKIHVVDSLNGCTATGLMAETAAKMANEGKNIDEILARLQEIQKTTAIYFVPDTLENLRKGGRIGNVRAAVGSLLGIKPILTVIDGKATDIGKCRGAAQVRQKLVQKFLECAKSLKEVIVIHTDAPVAAQELVKELKKSVPEIKINLHIVGSVIGTYIGAGAVGLAFEEKQPRW